MAINDHLVEIDLDQIDGIYARDEWDQTVKITGIIAPSISSCVKTIQSGVSDGCQMFLSIDNMYTMLYQNPVRFTKKINDAHNFLIIVIPQQLIGFNDIVSLADLTMAEKSEYRNFMQFNEYVPLNNIRPETMLYIDTIEFIRTYCQLQPFTIINNGVTYLFKHKLETIAHRSLLLTPHAFYEGHHNDLLLNGVISPLESTLSFIVNLSNYPDIVWGIGVCEYLTQLLAIELVNIMNGVNSRPRQLMIKKMNVDQLLNNERYIEPLTLKVNQLRNLKNIIIVLAIDGLGLNNDFFDYLRNKYTYEDSANIFDDNLYNISSLFELAKRSSFQHIPIKTKYLNMPISPGVSSITTHVSINDSHIDRLSYELVNRINYLRHPLDEDILMGDEDYDY